MSRVRTVWLALSESLVDRYAPALADIGWTVVPMPVSRVEAPADPVRVRAALRAQEHDLVLLTSAHAMHEVDASAARGWSAVCVGAATARAAAEAGFDVVLAGTGTAAALAAQLITEAPGAERILWLRGRDARGDGAAQLRAAGRTVDEVEAYVMTPNDGLATSAAAAPAPEAVVVGSPRAADLLAAACGGTLPTARLVALGATTDAHLRALAAADVVMSETPGPEGVAALLA